MSDLPENYPRLGEDARRELLHAAYDQGRQATLHYARLLAAEAGIAARVVYPTVARLVFRLTDDVCGASATLLAAYCHDGRRLWHIDVDDEWPDESLVTDHLAAAASNCPELFDTEGTDGEFRYVLDLDP